MNVPAALMRKVGEADPYTVQLKIDCGRYGDDSGILSGFQGWMLRYECAVQGPSNQ